jgi:hypothetical protein
MEVKEEFFNLGSFALQSGTQIWICEDAWIGNKPLNQQYPMYNIMMRKNTIIASVLISISINVYFRRALVENRLEKWHEK